MLAPATQVAQRETALVQMLLDTLNAYSSSGYAGIVGIHPATRALCKWVGIPFPEPGSLIIYGSSTGRKTIIVDKVLQFKMSDGFNHVFKVQDIAGEIHSIKYRKIRKMVL